MKVIFETIILKVIFETIILQFNFVFNKRVRINNNKKNEQDINKQLSNTNKKIRLGLL